MAPSCISHPRAALASRAGPRAHVLALLPLLLLLALTWLQPLGADQTGDSAALERARTRGFSAASATQSQEQETARTLLEMDTTDPSNSTDNTTSVLTCDGHDYSCPGETCDELCTVPCGHLSASSVLLGLKDLDYKTCSYPQYCFDMDSGVCKDIFTQVGGRP